jgi:uncharacterized membrane protein
MRRSLIALCLLLGLAMPAMAETAPPAVAPLTELQYLGVKTATYEIASSVLEAALFLAFFGGSAGTATAVFTLGLVSASAVYLINELAWEQVIPEGTARDDPGLVAGKTATYRVLGTLRGFLLGRALSGAEVATSAAYAITLAAADSVLFAAHEVGFARLRGLLLRGG